MLDSVDNALFKHIITTHEKSKEKLREGNYWLKDETSRLEAILKEAQDHITNSDGEPPKKKSRRDVLVLETDLDGEAIQERGSAEVE